MSAPLPGSSEHQQLVTLMRRRMLGAETSLNSRWDSWRRAERTYRLYVEPDELMEPREQVVDNRELLYTYPSSIVVPLSYAMIQTLISFWVTLFTSSKPYMRVDHRDDQSMGAAKAQELLLTYQLDWNAFPMLLYSWFLDACRYGLGIMSCGWEVRERLQTVRRMSFLPGPMGPVPIPMMEKRPVREYEGNILENVDPFLWRPDHRWPVARFQRGTFCGEEMWRSMADLRAKERQGIYQNVGAIPRYTQEHFKDNQSDRDRIANTNRYFGLSYEDPDDGHVMVEQIQVDLVPRRYGLSESEEFERWVVTLANRAVVLRADPFDFDHGDFTYVAIESSPDIHSLTNPGILEIMEPIHQHITWMVNSMLENARKALNDRLVFDPSILNPDDVMNPSAGKAIRVQEAFWGMPNVAMSAINQLKIVDVAKGNMDHVGFLTNLLERTTAAMETLQGQVHEEERTATEISSASQMGSSRLRTMAKLFSAGGFAPLARMMAQNNMQFMSQQQYISIVGGLEQVLNGMPGVIGGNGITISPEDIQGLFAFPVSDASMPLDPVRFARTWIQLMQLSMGHPILAQSINHVALWMEAVKAMGIPDPTRLLLPQQMQIMPDQQIEQQVQAGNLVPQGAPGQPLQGPPPGPGGPQMRAPMPMQPQPQGIRGEENRPR